MKSFNLTTLHGDLIIMEPGTEVMGYPDKLIVCGLGPWEAFSVAEIDKIVAYMEKWMMSQNVKKRAKAKKK